MHASFTWIDVDRATPPKDGGKPVSARAWFTAALVALFVAWMVWRWLL